MLPQDSSILDMNDLVHQVVADPLVDEFVRPLPAAMGSPTKINFSGNSNEINYKLHKHNLFLENQDIPSKSMDRNN